MADGVDVLFINPGDRKQIYQDLSDEFSAIEPPVFAGLFATYLRQKGHSVAIYDAPAMMASADEAALALGRNLALIGRELIQFEAAERTGPGSYRLGGLRRGLRGTEWAMADHVAGEPFLLIEEGRLVEPSGLAGAEGEAGGLLRVAAIGIGDVAPAEAMLTIRGEALTPLAEGEAEFYQFYGRPLTGGLFFEIVERRGGYDGYGAANAPFRIAALKRLLRAKDMPRA